MNYENQTSDQDEVSSPDTEGQEDLDVTLSSKNIAEDLEEQKLTSIGEECRRGYELDLKSREQWEQDLDEWTKLAMQIREPKNYPWADASNVKYPLLTTAAMQFAARAYPSLVPSDGKVVKSKTIGKDPQAVKYERADRVSTYMSYQIMYELKGWEEDMDKMLMMLPIIGTVFKKTYYDPSEDKICSYLVMPKNLVVNYWTRCLEEAERISEVIQISPRKLKERQNQKIYLDVDLGRPTMPTDQSPVPEIDDTTPYVLIEQHTFLDLDDDGYKEPYVVTFEKTSGKVVRIIARFYEQDVVHDGKKIVKITPTNYFTKFCFVPNPDGSFYGIGFGVLLGPLNESVNTLINQLLDSGHLSTLQAGFLGKGLRLKMGATQFTPGEWKPVNATGDDLRKQIFPLPTREPSSVLFQLMGTLITSGKELASVAEIFTGKMPGQNTPATTTMASIEQGMKVFTAVYKRIYRALEEEFKKLYELNHRYLDPNTYVNVLDAAIGPDDFNEDDYDICPGADPTAISQTEKLMKAQGLVEALQLFGPILDPIKIAGRVFEAQEQPNWQDLFSQEVKMTGQVPQQQDPKVAEIQMKMQLEQQKVAMKGQELQMKMELEGRSAEQKMAMEQQMHAQEMQMKQEQNVVDQSIRVHDARAKMAMNNMQVQQQAQMGQQKLDQGKAAFDQKQSQQKEAAKSSANKNSSSGSNTRSPKK